LIRFPPHLYTFSEKFFERASALAFQTVPLAPQRKRPLARA
jgi:hypothetical protein